MTAMPMIPVELRPRIKGAVKTANEYSKKDKALQLNTEVAVATERASGESNLWALGAMHLYQDLTQSSKHMQWCINNFIIMVYCVDQKRQNLAMYHRVFSILKIV